MNMCITKTIFSCSVYFQKLIDFPNQLKPHCEYTFLLKIHLWEKKKLLQRETNTYRENTKEIYIHQNDEW